MTKNHKQNSNFQITYFLVGSCHTADGAYSLLCELQEDRERVIKHYKVNELRERAKKMASEELLNSGTSYEKLIAEADLLEISDHENEGIILFKAAQDELAHINKCLKVVQPLRKYCDYPDLEAHELAQQEEWKFELIHRAENYMLTSGTIPADHFITMRMHPEFQTQILPLIDEVIVQLVDPKKGRSFLRKTSKNFDLPVLLNKII